MKTQIIEKISKTGKPYYVLEVQLTPTYVKTVFLEPAEAEIIKLYANK